MGSARGAREGDGSDHLISTAFTKFYAIFSYRWLPVGEVNFEDLTSASYQREGQGWEKLLGFCKTARGLGYELAWADTCCIDKHSNVELDEAIRSLFQWYR
ncbi:hypothetical protein K469DRAFT_662392 [Zopfia rhizophila CBS 207.26]|uniref:Heterokaryon incompatibility domain-containing protein n=1 Tax=Zopfia rhizophila CBS 207.26 TaxID=1314779 RepID=A0A6A6EBD1_9PEZI|nr:hypothetical protein K469DRAFT_662392 [Zopfia rhizophila CBS 207.26]